MEVTERRGRRRKQQLDDLKEMRGHWKLKKEVVEHPLQRIRSEERYGHVARPQNE